MSVTSITSPPIYGQFPSGDTYPTVPGTTSTSTGTSSATGTTTTSDTTTSTGTTSASSSGTTTTSSSSTTTTPLVPTGSFTTDAGDIYSLSGLFEGQTSSNETITSYQVALQGQTGDGSELLLNGVPVTTQTSFTPAQFAQLQFVAGNANSTQTLVVSAQATGYNSSGGVAGYVDSTPVVLTANVTGTRSVNALAALVTTPTGSDASYIELAQQSGVYTGYGTNKPPAVSTVGNFTSAAGDTYGLSNLFSATAPTGATIASYEVAVEGGGSLYLNGTAVTTQTSFTAAQFNQLQYVAGASGSGNIEVIAQTQPTDSSGDPLGLVDSPAVSITNTVTGDRSLNAANALITTPTGNDSSYITIAQESAIFTGFGSNKPATVTTVGNFTSAAGDSFTVGDLFTATAPTGSSIADYEVAVRGDGGATAGTLLLNGVPTTQTTFTAAQLGQLQFVAGSSGSTDIELVAQTNVLDSSGDIVGQVDSPAVSITNSVTGTRSINAAVALTTTPTGNDASTIEAAQTAEIFGSFGQNTRPTINTVGNFTSEASASFSVSNLFSASSTSTNPVDNYIVTVDSPQGSAPAGGQLLLNGVDVTGQTNFTAAQFGQLQFVAGTSGSSGITVVAESSVISSSGTALGTVDSQAVQITNTVSGTTSANAATALLSAPSASETAAIILEQEAGIYSGYGTNTRPGLTSVGNFNSDTGDSYTVADLYQTTAPTGSPITNYEVQVTGNATLELNGVNVTTQRNFTASELASLQFVTSGTLGDTSSLVVVAQTDPTNASGTSLGLIDSPAVSITATNTGTRSTNALAALTTTPSATDFNFVTTVQQAEIFSGFGSYARPTLETTVNGEDPSVSASSLATAIGAFQSSGDDLPKITTTATSSTSGTGTTSTTSSTSTSSANGTTSTSGSGSTVVTEPAPYSINSLFSESIGQSASLGTFTANEVNLYLALFGLGSSAVGGEQESGGNLSEQRFALSAYQKAQIL